MNKKAEQVLDLWRVILGAEHDLGQVGVDIEAALYDEIDDAIEEVVEHLQQALKEWQER